MNKFFGFFSFLLVCYFATTNNAGALSASDFVSADAYNYMYPYMNNQMKTELNPGTTPTQENNPILTVVKTINLPSKKVVARSATTRTSARSATSSGAPGATTTHNTNTNRGVVARSGTTSSPARSATSSRGTATTQSGRNVVARATRSDASYYSTLSNNTSTSSVATISSSRCLSDYVECMNGYCERPDTAYDRCYCSSKLAQIDAQYQDNISNLVTQILKMQTTTTWTDAQMNEYWQNMIGKYTGDNSWQNIDDALDIDWSSTESRVRGETAFITGHQYCSQHLRACSYMAGNMRDAYKSEIAQDCAAYEKSLSGIKQAAEALIDAYTSAAADE